MDECPDYSKYTLSELYDVHGHIDREKYPDRFALVCREIEKRKAIPAMPGKTGRWMCPQCGEMNPGDLSLCPCGYDVNRPSRSVPSISDEEALRTCPKCGFEMEAEAPEQEQELKLVFSGSAREYFRVWIVNLCLSLMTLGVFSAWAKVRKKRYFYSHTTLDGTPFQYLGMPVPILRGRVIAALAFVLYYAASHFFTSLLPYVLAAAGVLAPWVLARSAAFNARYSAFRNMTFHFDGGYGGALKALALWGIVPAFGFGMAFQWWGKYALAGIAALVFGVAFPWWMKRIKEFIVSHTSFGGRNGSFSATGGQFFSVYFQSGLIMVGVGIVVTLLSAVTMAIGMKPSKAGAWIILLPTYAGYVLAYAFVKAHGGNLAWNQTRLGPLRFRSTLSSLGLAKLYVTNALGIIASLGLLIPWAVMRTLKYRADHMQVLHTGALDEFQGSDRTTVGATGAETMDFFDLDISL